MWVRFWGTRGSIAKAGPSTVRYGGNTSCVEVRSASGAVLVLDCGTGAHGLGQALVREPAAARRGHLLISHTHWDHIQGLPFFAPLFQAGNEWHVYGPQGLGRSLRDVLAGQMEYTYFPISPADFSAHLAYHDLVEGSFEVDDIRVTTHYLNHPALTLAYRIEADGVTLVYATDHEPHLARLADGGTPPRGGEDEKHGQFLADADLVIHDTQYTAEEYPRHRGWGHSTLEYVVDLARAGQVRRLAMFHHDPLRHDDALDQLVARARARAHADPIEVLAAAEGPVIEVPRRRGAVAPVRAPAPTAAVAEAAPVVRTVLIAVADPALASTLQTAAAADGLRILAAADTDAALRTIADDRPDLVLVARDLHGDGGPALCRSVRARDADLPLVLVTPAAGVEPSMTGDPGVTDWLATPCSTMYARTRIRAWCLRRACRWRPAALPPDEPARQQAVRDLRLARSREDRFDRHTRIAAALFDVPIALLNIVDDDQQWTKSSHGCVIDGPVPRDMSFCARAILGPDVLEISDVWNHPLGDNPLTRANLKVRFYAGLPLAAPDGHRVGTLCLIDDRPRRLDDRQRGLLRDLGRIVEHELATR